MSHNFNTPLEFSPQPSRRFAVLLLVAHVGAGVCLLLSQIHWTLIAAGLCAVLGSGAYSIKRYALLRFAASVKRVKLAELECTLSLNDGNELRGELHPTTFSSQALVILRVKRGRKTIAVPLFSDMLPADDYRRLRVRLKICNWDSR